MMTATTMAYIQLAEESPMKRQNIERQSTAVGVLLSSQLFRHTAATCVQFELIIVQFELITAYSSSESHQAKFGGKATVSSAPRGMKGIHFIPLVQH